jgi:hypothetical protein
MANRFIRIFRLINVKLSALSLVPLISLVSFTSSALLNKFGLVNFPEANSTIFGRVNK